MKNFWPLRLSILAVTVATLTGCPATSNLMDLVSKEQEKPKKTLTVTDIPPEYEGRIMQVMAQELLDTLGERICLNGGMADRNVKEGKGKTTILEMGNIKSSAGVLAATAKNVMGIAKSCDNKERLVILSLLSIGSAEENPNIDSSLSSTFIYTKGINICEADVKEMPTYSFSEMETTLKFSDFMPASDCEKLVEIIGSMSKECPDVKKWDEYLVIADDTDKNKTFKIRATANNSNDNNVVKQLNAGDIVKVASPKKNKDFDRSIGDGSDGKFSFVQVYYDDDKEKKEKCGWAIEKKYSSTDLQAEEWIRKKEPK